MIELDEGTRKYFDAIKVNLGYVGHNAGWYSIKEIFEKSNLDESANLELIRSYAGYANSSNIDIYRYNTDGKIRSKRIFLTSFLLEKTFSLLNRLMK